MGAELGALSDYREIYIRYFNILDGHFDPVPDRFPVLDYPPTLKKPVAISHISRRPNRRFVRSRTRERRNPQANLGSTLKPAKAVAPSPANVVEH